MENRRLIFHRILLACPCTFSLKTLDRVRHAYNLYSSMSKSPAEPPSLSNPVHMFKFLEISKSLFHGATT